MTSAQASDVMDASMATSAISSIGGAFLQSSAIKAQGTYANSIAQSNAAMANLKASQTLQAGDVEASRKQLQTQGEVGTERAAAGASGIDVNKGSPAMVQAGTTMAGETDVATIKNNAQRQAWGLQTQAIQETEQGQMEQLTAEQKSTQTLATGGLQAVTGPLGIYANALRWQRYLGGGSGGTSGLTFAWGSGSGSDSGASSDSDV
jgi:hypothetical protein